MNANLPIEIVFIWVVAFSLPNFMFHSKAFQWSIRRLCYLFYLRWQTATQVIWAIFSCTQQLYMCASEIHKLIQSANYQRHRLYRATVVWSVHSVVGQWPLFTGPMSRLIKIESGKLVPYSFLFFLLAAHCFLGQGQEQPVVFYVCACHSGILSFFFTWIIPLCALMYNTIIIINGLVLPVVICFSSLDSLFS